MTKKDEVIEAWEKIIKKLRDPVGKKFWYATDCELCKVIRPVVLRCRGCPLCGAVGSFGCTDYEILKLIPEGVCKEKTEAFNKVADLLKSWLPEIEAHPPEHFTKEGWVPFNLKE